jgi:antitoxin ParD1/3/4
MSRRRIRPFREPLSPPEKDQALTFGKDCLQYHVLVYVRSENPIMSKDTSFSLGEHFTRFVEGQVGQGRYSSASDVLRAALRLLEEQEAKLDALRAALVEGEQSGPSTPFDFEAFIARKRDSQPSTT